ncbi:MAG TPA: sodium:solute symporter family protein [Rhodocyclaceae bacterium]|nr:sodium:solute symporter family protein [Rhodocyclaceae bacterium]HMZ82767.1 sodium:solute symporter family protein [Rhodocyclaceae bacterium]HNA02498.1 sodium:solute symporter family protein [Rhodocyclaceae bacterium]HNB78887.1 sodium:solute symporter family protein [Rhodocyclaceae bacterium]HNC60889.1 sodium:solute symporter family protein [Rhodocyclaceae bacterium]
MLVTFVILYLLVSIGIGLYAATRVHSAKDYVVAGRSLPIYIVTATVFATWFGSETVLGISSTFIKDGLAGIVADPFGSSMCLILVGIFFAAKLYRMNLLTIGDYYRRRYGRAVELICSMCIVLSYLGWVSAQVIALGLVFNVLSNGSISQHEGIAIGTAIVLVYTLFGGMWSVALTDFFQMTIIMVGMLYIAFVLAGMTGGVGVVIAHASEAGKFQFWPELTAKDVLAFVGAWVTMMFGSIPQQDVFQRVMSAKNERIAVTGSILGGSLYFLFAFVPIFLAYSALLIDPAMTNQLIEKDAQLVLPNLILAHTPLFAQVMFFGALLSAIMSTASGTLLAPSVTFSENILRGFFAHLSDKQFLWITRVVVVCFTGVVLVTAFNSEMSIYGMVENAYKITLVAAFIPLVFGLYWKRATTQGALAAIAAGLSVWLLLEYFEPEGLWPPQLAGLIAAFLGMIAGSLLPQWVRRRTEHPPEHPLGHAAAHPHAHGPGHTHHHGASN